MSIAITGASGRLGRLVVQKLKGKVDPALIVAMVRDSAKTHDLGVAVRQADYDQPAQLEKALQGVEKVLLISSSEEEGKARQHLNVIAAAVKAGVKYMAYTSLLRTETSPISIAADHIVTERAMRESGLDVTMLRNGWYTENYADFFLAASGSGTLYGCAGDGRFSSATRSDYADAAVKVLTSQGHEGKIYELAGDTSYTLADVAKELSRLIGKVVTYQNASDSEYIAALKRMGLPHLDAAKIANFDTSAAKGALFDEGRQLSALIGHSTEPLATTLQQMLKR
ncbi:SDR family oxidoreductase [Variovorax sp. Root411]|uniref:SDR family oxidoreductase n=1 Tax=Variovorax sp. Root411 TaxID=1736530 RepID=UPI0006F383A0|nr:SDR family oxidoreductase [Variovorax sp. Root411]KQW65083.1 NAD(P)-dependent oxidoreductase [Variovorax sp. Root411]